MRKLFFIYAAMWLVLIVLSPNPPAAWASNPTVTVSKLSGTGENAEVYSISFSTAISNPDTVFIFNQNSSWFSIDGVGKHPADSLITLECYSSETTADSVRLAILYQVSSAASPTVTAATLPNSGWTTALVDSATINNRTTGLMPGISRFAKQRLAGQASKMRIVIHEISGTVKDATQTFTLRLVIPKRNANYLWR